MNKIITVSREFGSGGRELGKRLAELLHIAYYDGEIIAAIAKRSEMAEEYVNQIVENRIVTYYPITVAASFSAPTYDSIQVTNSSIYAAQTEIIEEMAQKSDCVIVGRCANYILREQKPFNIFVYADMESKLKRCRAQDEKAAAMTDKQLKKNINAVDKARAHYYRFYSGEEWGDKLGYDLCVNTSNADIPQIAEAIAAMVRGHE